MNLESLHNKTILLFGQPRAFSQEEFSSQLGVHGITATQAINDEVSLIVEGKMMTPYEQNEVERLYALGGYEFVDIDSFERELAKHLNEDALLMSLKLSGNKERLKSFIQNTTISDTLFFKLLKMYKWGEDDFFENDDNRDVSAAFISRFYENIERNHNVQYATTGFVHLIKQTQDRELLDAIFSLKPIKYNPKMKMQLARNSATSEYVLKKLLEDESYEVKEALSLNEALSEEILKELIQDDRLLENVAKNITLNGVYFELLQQNKVALALNPSLSLTMQQKLYATQNKEVLYALALNDALDESILMQLVEGADEEMQQALYENKMMPQEKLIEAYNNNRYLEQLARNENTPIEILYQLQLDARYERYVKTNASFGKNIQQENIGWL